MLKATLLLIILFFTLQTNRHFREKKVACHILILDILIRLLSIVFNIDGNNITLLDYFFYNEITIFFKKMLLLFSI